MSFISFWNIWYWILLVVSWSVSSHWTLGVPHDMVIEADRKGGTWAEHCESMTRANIFRIVMIFQRAGLIATAMAGFILATLATLGFQFGFEFARALFVLLLAAVIAGAFSVRLALKLSENPRSSEELRTALRHRRFWNQVTGLFAIVLSTFVAVAQLV